MRRRGWLWFGAWALAGALVSLAVLSAASIGLFVAPLALIAVWWLLRSSAGRAEAVGLVTGAGAPVLLVALLQRGSDSLDARPWLAAGLLLVVTGVVAYSSLRRTRPEPPSAPTV